MPLYISEMSPKEYRGIVVSIIGPLYNFGFLVALGLNIGFDKYLLGWNTNFGLVGLCGFIYAVGMLFLPHTPR
jgi:hypothetical protein